MSGRLDQIRRAAEARADRVREEVAAVLRDVLPGLHVETEGETVRLSGRRANARWSASQAGSLLRSQLR